MVELQHCFGVTASTLHTGEAEAWRWDISCAVGATPMGSGEGKAHAEIAARYGVHFTCVAGGCFHPTATSYRDCDLRNVWGAVFLVTGFGNPEPGFV